MADQTDQKPTLVLGGTGKTGRRIIERLEALGVPTRLGSRNTEPPFDWEDPTTWPAALEGTSAVAPCLRIIQRAIVEQDPVTPLYHGQ